MKTGSRLAVAGSVICFAVAAVAQQKNTADSPRLWSTHERLWRTAIDDQATGHQGIHGDQQKADSVDPGPGSELVYYSVVHLRVAKLIPRAGSGSKADAPRPCRKRRTSKGPTASNAMQAVPAAP